MPRNEANEMKERLYPLFKKSLLNGAVLNFKGLEHISSGEIGNIVSFFQFLESLQKKMVLCQLNDKLLMLFRMTDLDKIIDIYETEKDAIASFSPRAEQSKL
ncbi:MAG: STAS domain-containing protein [SAR324 cluster bacterium]|nr:STAS domain-containing protein [SAR324 cluster bacterium]